MFASNLAVAILLGSEFGTTADVRQQLLSTKGPAGANGCICKASQMSPKFSGAYNSCVGDVKVAKHPNRSSFFVGSKIAAETLE
eukprot:scaffold34671_cov230-Amphora_coffeaeformis.AAC.2